MLILGIETATEQVSVALGGHEGVLASFDVCRGRRHAETLMPAIEFVLRQADVSLDEVGAVAVDVGPGLFTGMRVGIATAKAIAFAQRVPVIPVSSLDLLAFPLRWASGTLVVPVVDARRGELFYAFYRSVPGGVMRLGEPAVGTPDDLAGELIAIRGDVVLVGDGALRHRDLLDDACQVAYAEQWLSHPSAAPLVQLAHAKALREDWVNAGDVQPLYLRKPDAEINWTVREGAR